MAEKKLKMAELLHGSTNAGGTQGNKENSSNTQDVEMVKIEKTPFHAIRTEKGCCVIFGKVRVTDWVETMPEAIESVEGFNWNILIGVVVQVATDVTVETLRERYKVAKTEERTIDDISVGGSEMLNAAKAVAGEEPRT